MHESSWENEGGWIKEELDALDGEEIAGSLIESGPSEESLVTVALLMRIYDIQMAILSHFDKPTADKIYDMHAKGGHYNPPIYVPKVTTGETD
jgi:hypothetical protein